jgi:hypothetical protein
MTQEHPITPPPELVVEWWNKCTATSDNLIRQFAIQAARWGADQELEACCEWVRDSDGYDAALGLRADRRPKPPSLREQALGALYAIATGADDTREFHQDLETIKQALESLPS